MPFPLSLPALHGLAKVLLQAASPDQVHATVIISLHQIPSAPENPEPSTSWGVCVRARAVVVGEKEKNDNQRFNQTADFRLLSGLIQIHFSFFCLVSPPKILKSDH